MGGTCSKHQRDAGYRIYLGELKGRDYMGDGRII